MNKFGHILFALLIYVLLYYLLDGIITIDSENLVIGLFICLLYSLIPDIDLNKSWIRKKINFYIFILILIFGIIFYITKQEVYIYFIIILLIIEIILYLVKHRTIFHTLLFGIIICIPLYFLNPIYMVAGLIGILTHYIGDKI